MKGSSLSPIDWIDTRKDRMLEQLIEWSRINSFSDNLEGLALMLAALHARFSSLEAEAEILPLPPRTAVSEDGSLVEVPHGKALRLVKRPNAKKKLLLAGHMDTVYSPNHPFQDVKTLPRNRLGGPGVADMKGGLVVMLTALEALERHPQANRIGWEVLITPDEEVGSVGSHFLYAAAAKRNHAGLLFEPSYPDGAVVSSRKGSCNLAVVSRGKSVHAGRDFAKGRNAIAALAKFIVKADALNDGAKGITVNAGNISGGGPVNIVPDLALCRMNARAVDEEDFIRLQNTLKQLAREGTGDGITLSLHILQARGPKLFDAASLALYERINAAACAEGTPLSLRSSGGVCDGNILAELDLPVIDTLGVIGGEIHTQNEYMEIDSLVSRSRLVARFLIDTATSADD